MTPRHGFTLLETIVVVAILAVLIALTLGGVQRVREVAARASCQNNLRQQGLALQQYANSHGSLPAGCRFKNGKDPMPLLGWQARLLPYIEQVSLWDQTVAAFKIDTVFSHKPPHGGAAIVIPIYGCPTDDRTKSAQAYSGQYYGATSYLGVSGTQNFRLEGVLYLDSAVKLTDIRDGTSNTIAIGQHDARCRSTGFAWNQANPGCGVFNPSTGKVTGVPSWKVPPVTSHATTFADAEMGDALLYGTSVAGPLPAATFQVAPTLADCDYRLLQAYTPRGLMVGIADGSVRVVSPTITPRTFWAAVTPAGGEVLGSDW